VIERELEADRIVAGLAAEKVADMEAWEQAVLVAALAAGAKVLEAILAKIGSGRQKHPVRCVCGATMDSVGLRDKQVVTVLGPVDYRRSLFVCPVCDAARFPGDRALDIEHTGFSPGVRRLMARAGARGSFPEAEEDLRVYAHVEVDRRDIERVAEDVGRQIEAGACRRVSDAPAADIPVMYVSYDGTAAPMRKGELKGCKGKRKGEDAKGREVKVGCVFTQTTVDKDGFAVRDEASTTYVAGIESSTFFGDRIYTEAVTRGIEHARRVVVLTDGAAYNRTIAQTHFSGALHIIDLYHAREHLTALGDTLRIEPLLRAQWKDVLDAGQVESLCQAAHAIMPRSGARRVLATKQIRYFEKNAARMRYADYRTQGLFVGSGVVEAGCRSVVGLRCKKPGMFWSRRGAHAILQTRCSLLSRRYDADWDDRAYERISPAA
jgi:hypothetical protein